MSIINGYGKPVVRILPPEGDSPEREIKVILPQANSGGLVETYEVKKITHELINIDSAQPAIINAQKILGYMITFTLHYDRWITGIALYDSVKKIFDAAKAGRKMILQPRDDAPWREFEVMLHSDTLELGLNKGGRHCRTHRLPVIIFKTVKLEPDLKWFPPDYSEPGGGTGIPIEGSN